LFLLLAFDIGWDIVVAGLVHLLFIQPKVNLTYKGQPTYSEYAELYHILQLFNISKYSTGIHATFVDTKKMDNLSRLALVSELNKYKPMGVMNAEALCKIINIMAEKLTIANFVARFGSSTERLLRGNAHRIS